MSKAPSHIQLFQSAEILLRQGKIGAAEGLLQESARRAPGFVAPLIKLSRLSLGKPEAGDKAAKNSLACSREYLTRAVSNSPDDPLALNELGYYLHVVLDKSGKAAALFERSAATSLQQLEDSWVGLIVTLCDQGKLARARKVGQRALGLFPKSVRLAMALEPANR